MDGTEEQFKFIREEDTNLSKHHMHYSSQHSPPKELTESHSRESSSTKQPEKPKNTILLGSPDKGPMQFATKATKPLMSTGEKRARQVYGGVRPSQVNVPQQTESDGDEDQFDEDEDEDDDNNYNSLTPNLPDQDSLLDQRQDDLRSTTQNADEYSYYSNNQHLQIIEQHQQTSEADGRPESPSHQNITSLNGQPEQPTLTDASEMRTVEGECGRSVNPQPPHSVVRGPSPDCHSSQQQYSPRVDSGKSPLGFTDGADQRSQSFSQMETVKSMDRSQMIGDEYCLLKDLGEGTFGNVKLGKHLSSGQLVAVKILEKKRITDQADVERVIREIKILKSIRHPNIIKLYEIIETKARIFLIMEYACGGELFDYIVRKDRLSEKEACRFYNQIVSGIEFLHSKGIAHRDLKPENLLLDKQKNLKIVDFGLSNTYKPGQTLKTACGSPCYAAPEMIAGKRYNGIEVDVWSSGVTLYAMLCGFLPFEDPDTALLYKKILKGDFELPDFLTNRSIKFLQEILCTDPVQRIQLQQIKVHPWLTQFDQKPHQQHLDRTTAEKNCMMLSTAEENKNYNTQVYGTSAKGQIQSYVQDCQIGTNSSLESNNNMNSSLAKAENQNRKQANSTRPQKKNNNSVQAVHNNQYFCAPVQSSGINQNASINSSQMTATVTKPAKSHQKSISETHMPGGTTTSGKKRGVRDSSSTIQGSSVPVQQQVQHSRPSTSLKKAAAASTATKASKSHNAAATTAAGSTKRPKQKTTLSAIISSPRIGGGAANATSGSLKVRVDEQISSYHTKSERKTTTSQNLKEKLRTLKTGVKHDSSAIHKPLTALSKVRAQKIPTALSLLNNTIPMPKLKIDLASPSTGGSTDLGLYASQSKTGSIPSKDVFKNNLARVAKNSAAAAQLHMQQQVLRQKSLGAAATTTTMTASSVQKQPQSVSLKKQMVHSHLSSQLMSQNIVTQSRSAIGAGASNHSSLSNKRKKQSTPRGVSHNSSSTAAAAVNQFSQYASKTKKFPRKQTSQHQALKTLSFERNQGKTRGSAKLPGGGSTTASATLQSVHPYSVMAMPLHSISQHNLKENVLAQMSGLANSSTIIATKKSSNRHSLGQDQAQLTKVPKTFIKSQQVLQINQNQLASQSRLSNHITPANQRALLQRHGPQKMQSSSSIETQLRNVKIPFSTTKKPIELGLNNTVYSKVMAQQAIQKLLQNSHEKRSNKSQSRQSQSLEAIKQESRTASCDTITLHTMRVCAQSSVQPDWCTTEAPNKIIMTLEALLPLLNAQVIHRKTSYLYSLKVVGHPSLGAETATDTSKASRSIKCELELMQMKNAPFVTVVRLTQKVKLKQPVAQTAVTSAFEETAESRQDKLGQFTEFSRKLKQGLNLD